MEGFSTFVFVLCFVHSSPIMCNTLQLLNRLVVQTPLSSQYTMPLHRLEREIVSRHDNRRLSPEFRYGPTYEVRGGSGNPNAPPGSYRAFERSREETSFIPPCPKFLDNTKNDGNS